jgi:transposase
VAQLVVGIDPHKRSLTVGVVDPVGVAVATATFDNRSDGIAALLAWLAGLAGQVMGVGVEGSAGHGRHAALALVGAGYDTREVPARRTAQRRRARRRPKTDVEDALAIARATAAEPSLGPVKPGGSVNAALEELAVVRAHRTMLVARRQVMLNHAEAVLAALPLTCTDALPGGKKVWPRLTALVTAHRPTKTAASKTAASKTAASKTAATKTAATKTAASTAAAGEAAVDAQLALLVELHRDIVELDRRVRGMDQQMAKLIAACGSTLLEEHGIGVVGAAALLVEVADPTRFRSESAFNRWWGGAPVAVSSGEGDQRPVRHRLDLLGNRTINQVIYTMSVTQARSHPGAREYLQRKRGEGKTPKEARRAHKSLLGRRIIRRMWDDHDRQQRTLNDQHAKAA